MTVILDELAKVQKLSAADAAGDEKAHGELLKGIRKLQLAAETPLETTSRLNFQVRIVVGSALGDGLPPMTTSYTHNGQFMPATSNF